MESIGIICCPVSAGAVNVFDAARRINCYLYPVPSFCEKYSNPYNKRRARGESCSTDQS